ncbi:sigma-54 interaction domain-containing protein [Desulfococcus sp.]|uniref:sigma-54 interaction domain-containing protein n=1 Tax=Desulfococcus sp. TaxID=2025834 RepID=UPI003594005E
MLIKLVLAVQDKRLQRYLEQSFSLTDIRVESCGALPSPWQKVMRSCGDIIVISESIIPRPSESGIAMLNDLPESPTTVILHDGDSSEEHAQLVAAGADVVLFSGVSKKRLQEAIETTLESRRQLIQLNRFHPKHPAKPQLGDFVLESDSMRIFIDEVRQVSASNSSLLIMGETGVGKEHLAKAIHAESPRSAGPFIAVNTAALPEQILESELFGHAEGAFTGAVRSRRGTFELAHNGTIFLDEIGEMPLHLQAKLLRVLQDYEVKPIGGESPIWVDVRVIAATNRDLEKEVSRKNFRKDLYYRLSVVTLTIPPLRQRKEDIPHMAGHFLDLYRYKIGRDVGRISPSAMKALSGYDWPGNVRELMNVIERAILICKSHEITVQDLPSVFHRGSLLPHGMIGDEAPDLTAAWKGKTLPEVRREMVAQIEKRYIEMVLAETGGRVGRAARMAGIHSRGLYDKMKALGVRKEDFRK